MIGIGPGQRETTSTNLETQWRLIVYQTITNAIFGDIILFGLMLLVFIPWAVNTYSRHHWSWWIWFKQSWEWLLLPYLLPWFFFLSLGIWRFSAEVADPSYPTPRDAVPAQIGGVKPNWPWRPDIPNPDLPEPEIQYTPSYTVRFERHREDNGWDLGEIPNLDSHNWHRFIAAAVRDIGVDNGGVTISESSASIYDIGRREFEQTRDALLDAKLIRWRDPSHHQQGIQFSYRDMEFWNQYLDHPPTLPGGSSVRRGNGGDPANERTRTNEG